MEYNLSQFSINHGFYENGSTLSYNYYYSFLSPNSFAVITSVRVLNLVAESPAMMHKWIEGETVGEK